MTKTQALKKATSMACDTGQVVTISRDMRSNKYTCDIGDISAQNLRAMHPTQERVDVIYPMIEKATLNGR